MKLSYYLLLLMALFSKNSSGAGFLPDEVVHLSDSSVNPIQNLQVYDETISFNGTDLVSDRVTKNVTKTCDNAIKISFPGATLTVTPDQLLFLPKSREQWVAAKNLKPGDLVLLISGEFIPVVATEELKKVMKFHDLTIQDQHNLFVTKLGILAHNEPATLVLGALAAAGGAVATMGPEVVAAEVAGI